MKDHTAMVALTPVVQKFNVWFKLEAIRQRESMFRRWLNSIRVIVAVVIPNMTQRSLISSKSGKRPEIMLGTQLLIVALVHALRTFGTHFSFIVMHPSPHVENVCLKKDVIIIVATVNASDASLLLFSVMWKRFCVNQTVWDNTPDGSDMTCGELIVDRLRATSTRFGACDDIGGEYDECAPCVRR